MKLTEYEKAAVLLYALGSDRAQVILNQLSAGDLLPIINAMKKIRQIPPEVRRSVLEEVNELLEDQAAEQNPKGDQTEQEKSISEAPNLLDHIGPYVPGPLDLDKIDWEGAGFNFDDPSSEDPPYEPPEGRR